MTLPGPSQSPCCKRLPSPGLCRGKGLYEPFSNKHMENLQVPAEDRLMGTVYRTRGRHLRTIVDALTRREDEFRVVIVACLPTLLSARQMNLRLEF